MKFREKIMKKISNKNIDYLILGKMIVIFSLGTIFSIQLVIYGYFILILSALVLSTYASKSFMSWKTKSKTSYNFHVFGMFGTFLLLLFLGIQSPQVPFKNFILLIGVILFLPAIFDLLRSKKK